ncbi:MAG: choline-sulfatase [Cytophagaceae bacterium SCN 52-12]|nr:MAG: choline-sulfatase [Cytophagaceae bacterium SCN 52-12]
MSNQLSVLFLTGLFLVQCFDLTGMPSGKDQSPGKPNIVFIFTDDQRYNTIHALGGDEVITPNLDALVAGGTTFTHAYNMGGWHGAICVASRTMLLTGKSLWQAQKIERDLSGLVTAEQLWVQQMKKAGYETYMTGKWHVRTDPSKIIDHVVNERPGMPNQTPEGYNRPLSENDTLWTPWNMKFEGFWKGGRHWSEVLADDAVGFMESAAQKPGPFFMYLAFNAPHDPRQAPKKFVDLYPLEKIRVPASYMDLYPFREEIGAGAGLRDEQLAPFPRTAYAVKKQIQEYYASITHLDEQIGRILSALARTGKLQNTYIIFTSDHGLAVGHHGLMGKQNMYDHSVRVPLVISGPGIPKGERRPQQVYLQDVAPTAYQMAKIDKPEGVFFNSMLPMAGNAKAKSPYDEIYGAYMNLQRMVRTDRYKLIVYPEAKKLLLFDLQKDPDEMQDLADNRRHRSVLEEMKTRLTRQQAMLGDTLDLEPLFRSYGGLPAKRKRG